MTVTRILLAIALIGTLGACNGVYGPSVWSDVSPQGARVLRGAPVAYTAAREPVVILGVQ